MTDSDRNANDERRFLEFVGFLPRFLEGVVDQIRADWDGSPLLVVARFREEDLDTYIVPGAGEERLEEIVEAFRASENVPAAAAMTFSGPLFTPAGQRPDRATLTIFAADAAGHEEWLFRQLGEGNDGSPEVSELPDGVEVQVLPSVTTDLVRDLLLVCAKVTDGSDLDPEAFAPTLQNAKAQLAE